MGKLIEMTNTPVSKMCIENRIKVHMSEEVMRILNLSDEARIAVIGDLELLSEGGKAYFKEFGEQLLKKELKDAYYCNEYLARLHRMIPQTIDCNFKRYIGDLKKLWRIRNESSVDALGDISTTELNESSQAELAQA